MGEGFTLLPSPVFCNEYHAMCCFSDCCGECEGEGKKENSLSAPARRIEWEFVWGREVLRETKEEAV